MYRVLGASIISGFICLFFTPLLIKLLRKKDYGQLIREDGPHAHFVKHGTPTMGGILIVLGSATGFLIMSDRTSTGLVVLATMAACGFLGFIDDYIQIKKKRSLGLKPSIKFVGQILIAAGFALAVTRWCGTSTKLSFLGELPVTLGGFFFLWVFLMIIGTTNAVNLTDGLDGLASGSFILVMAAYLLIAFTMFRHPLLYKFAGSPALDTAILCGAVLGACVGFLWWNAAPAHIFMGDTGSLALGGMLAAMAIVTYTQLLLPILGGLFVIEALSVIIQVGVFKVTGGKRVFKMAPIHHHFELSGWSEFTVMVRLWIIAGFFMLVGFAIFYVNFVGRVP